MGRVVAAAGPIDVLNTNGLIKVRTFFVVPSEDQVLQGLENLRPYMARTEGKWIEWAAIIQNEYEFQTLTDYRIQVRATLNDYNAQLGRMPRRTPVERYNYQLMTQERDMVNQELKATNTQIALREKRRVGPVGKQRAGCFQRGMWRVSQGERETLVPG